MIEKPGALMYFTFATHFFRRALFAVVYNTMNSDEASV